MKDIELKNSRTITAQTKIMKANWTQEAIDDIKIMVGYMNKSQSIYNLLQQLKSDSSRNNKLKLLAEYTEYPDLLKQLIRYTYNHKHVYNIRKIPEYNHTIGKISLEDILSPTGLLQRLMDREVTGKAAINEFIYTLENTDCKETSYILIMIINHTFDIGADIKTFNKAFDEIIVEEHGVLLCEPADDKLLDKIFTARKVLGQLKYDAMRIEVNSSKVISLVTRNGGVITTGNESTDTILNIPFINAKDVYKKYGYDIEGTVYLDGELVFLDADKKFLPRAKSNGIATKCLKGTKEEIFADEFKIVAWDIVSQEEKDKKLNIPCEIRLEICNELIAGNSICEESETIELHSKAEAIELAIKYIKQGLEGCIVKDADGYWDSKRVQHQIKLKAERECELRIIGMNLSTDKKYKGLVGSILCDNDEKTVLVSISGMTDSQRTEYLDESFIGKVVTIRFNEIIKGDKKDFHSLFLPRIEEIRYDKDSTDDLETIKKAPFIVV